MSGFFMPDLMLCTIHFHPRGMAEAESLDVMTQIRSGPKDALSDAYREKLINQSIGFAITDGVDAVVFRRILIL